MCVNDVSTLLNYPRGEIRSLMTNRPQRTIDRTSMSIKTDLSITWYSVIYSICTNMLLIHFLQEETPLAVWPHMLHALDGHINFANPLSSLLSGSTKVTIRTSFAVCADHLMQWLNIPPSPECDGS